MKTSEDSRIQPFLQTERLEKNLFRGESRDLGTPQVYGGQVLGQAIQSAQKTVEDRVVHSAHAYFLRKGEFDAPIIYDVERSRDGRSFSTRRVVAIQHGRPIFTMSASFQAPESGFDYQQELELPSPPEEVPASLKLMAQIRIMDNRIFGEEFHLSLVIPEKGEPLKGIQFWIKARRRIADDDNMHRAILAYISDYGLLRSTLLPHGFGVDETWTSGEWEVVGASIDHALWFHRPFRIDEWLFYDCSPVSTMGARGLARGGIYNQQGVLVASTQQEGLIRRVKTPEA